MAAASLDPSRPPARQPADTGGESSAAAWRAALGLAVGLTLARSVIPLIWSHAFDADEAILGLMAKHLAEGRAFPLFLYGLPYLLGVEAWASAPFFLVAGPSVVALRLPLLLVNVLTAWLLIRILHRDGGLTPTAALGASLPFVLAPPFLATGPYMSASGGNVEPCLYVLLLWALRRRPWWFGLVLGLGFLHRQFTVYGAFALLAIQTIDRSLLRRETLERWLVVAIACAGSWQLVDLLRVWASPLGPGTSFTVDDRAALEAATAFACVEPSTFLTGMRTFAGEALPLMTGLETHPQLAAVLGTLLALAAVRTMWVLATARGSRPPAGTLAPCVYIGLVGLFSVVGYVALRCGVVNVGTLRYALLTPFLIVGISAAFFRVEPARWSRACGAAALSVWALVSVSGFGSILTAYLRDPPSSEARLLADYLVTRDVRHPIGDYWDAYAVTFLANERVRVASDGVVRIMEYQREFDAQAGARFRISREPCVGDGHVAVPGTYWLCPAGP